LNETTCFVQNDVVSSTVKKERRKQCDFEWYYTSPSSLGHAQAGEEGDFLPCNASFPFSPKNPKLTRPMLIDLPR
jgi:hypothetical protein